MWKVVNWKIWLEFTYTRAGKKPQKEIRKNKIIKSTFEVNEKP